MGEPEPTPAPTKPRNFVESDGVAKVIDRARKNKLGGADFEYIEQFSKDAGPVSVVLATPAGTNRITDTLPVPKPGKVHRIEVRVRVVENDADKVRGRGE